MTCCTAWVRVGYVLSLAFVWSARLACCADAFTAATVTCSSQYSPQHGPANVADGALKTNWVARKLPCWIQIDLGSVRQVGKIVWNSDRGGGYALRTPVSYRFVVSTTGRFAGEQQIVAAETANREGAMVTHVIRPVAARYVRMEITATPAPRHLQPSIDEIQAFAPERREVRGPVKTLPGVAVRFSEFRPDRAREGRGFVPTRSKGMVYVYLRNDRPTPLRLDRCSFDGTAFPKLAKARRVMWWRVAPNPVPPGATAEFAAHVRGVVQGDRVRVGLTGRAGGSFEADVEIAAQPLWIDFVGFSADLTRLCLYVRTASGEHTFRRLLLGGRDLSSRVRWATPRFDTSVTSGALELDAPLRKGQTVVLELHTDGARTGLALRAFPSVFPFLLCTNEPPGDKFLLAARQHCHSGVMAGVNTLAKSVGYSLHEDRASRFGPAISDALARVHGYGLDFMFYGPYSAPAAEAALGEIEVFGPDAAPCPTGGRPVSAANSGYGTAPAAVLDGRQETKWVAGAERTWIQIDLGQETRVGRLVWSGPRETYRMRIPSDYDILGSATGEFAGEQLELARVRGNRANWRVECKLRPERVRYVRMTIHRTYPRFEFRPAGLERDVLAWLKDEPDSGLADRRVAPQEIVRIAARSFEEAPRVRFGIRPCTPDTEDYCQQGDILGTGPVWRPSRRPTWSVLAVRHHDLAGAKHDVKRPGWLLARAPSPIEARIQAYSAAAEGAKGLWYWHYGSFTWGTAAEGKGVEGVRQIGLEEPSNAELWREIARVGAELRAIGPFLARADMGQPLDTSCPGAEATLFRSGLDTCIVLLLNIQQADGRPMRTEGLYPGVYIASEKLRTGAAPTRLSVLRDVVVRVQSASLGDAPLAVAVQHSGVRPLPIVREAGLLRVTVPTLDDALAVVLTGSPAVVDEISRRLSSLQANLRSVGAMRGR